MVYLCKKTGPRIEQYFTYFRIIWIFFHTVVTITVIIIFVFIYFKDR